MQHNEDYLANVRGHDDGALIVRFWNKRETPVIDAKGMDVSSINRRLDNVRRRAHELLGEEISPPRLRPRAWLDGSIDPPFYRHRWPTGSL